MRLIWLAMLLSSCHDGVTKASATEPVTAKAHAIDGDTVAIDYRLFGADAFEKRQLCRRTDGCWPCGKAAQDFTSRLLKRNEVTIRTVGTASYGRPVATIDVAGKDLGEALIDNGLAVPTPGFLKADPRRASLYEAAYHRPSPATSAPKPATSSTRPTGGMVADWPARRQIERTNDIGVGAGRPETSFRI